MPYIKNALIRYRIIDRFLRNKYKPYPSKMELRQACEEALYGLTNGENICDSTIEKDLFSMRMDHDAPIKYSKRHNGYYYLDPTFSINDIPLTEEELVAIKFAANTLSQFKDSGMFKQFGNAIDKIVDRVSISSNPNDTELNHYVQFESAVSTGGSELLPILLEAIRNKLITTFNYASFVTATPKARRVIPLLLKEYRNRWYLISFDFSKNNIITYALDRLTELEITQEISEQPTNFNPDHYFKYAVGISANNESSPDIIELKAQHIAARYIQSQPFHASQHVIHETENHTTFSLEIVVSEEFIRALLSYAGEIEVLKPASLRENIASRIDEMRVLYGV